MTQKNLKVISSYASDLNGELEYSEQKVCSSESLTQKLFIFKLPFSLQENILFF